ncbi:oligopeptide/dipeptide ABC transporter ATP-binding protein [Clostridium sp. AM33-3]|jgi:oligopeptide/dipeptide ABC transporter ATP-binding protein|uniref:ABC transporter ATP-binding protein n=1 Tax=Clostridium sp. AM33-3 TaxID=2292304 RepID=UPI000E4F771F|nr:oligopeptide/dipeptide ABC transporter ATP-binding protein [Clostridium sp. AM33-3]RHT24152.1 ATP-binding cassette domain-containing protein [Clostridium sp. AM33-3]
MAEEKKPLIEVKNLKKYFQVGSGKTLHAVDDVSFSLEKGQTLGLVGESGCGKSTVGTVIMRLQDPTSGELLFEGKDIFKCKNRKENLQYCKEMQIVFQDPYSSLNPKKTIRSILSEGYLIHHTVSKKDLNDVLALLSEKTGISKDMWDQYPHELDGGKRQVVGIARALSMNPKFIVCDEPVSSLDVSVQAKVLNLLMDLQKEMNLSYLFISHDLSVVKHISDRIAVMYLGQIVETADKETLFADTRHPYSIALLSAIPKVDVENKVSRIVLKGDVPSPINPKPVCRFANRCWMSQPICFEQEPELKEVSPGHCVKCHFAEKSRELMIGAEKTGLN